MADITVTGDVLPQHAQAAFEVEERIRTTIRNIRTAWIRLAEDLHRFNDLELWRDLGHPSFEAWLAGPDIELERRWVYELIAMWRELVVKRGVTPAQLEPVAVSKVREVLPAIRRGQVSIEDALADCEVLGRRDLEAKYRGVATSSVAPGHAPLDADTEPEYAICHACGSRYAVGRAAA